MTSQPLLITLAHLELRLHISNLKLLGWIRVDSGELRLTDCRIEEAHRGQTAAGRALSIGLGRVEATRTILRGHAGGAIETAGGSLLLVECTIRDSRSTTGGALLIRNGSEVHVVGSSFINNTAIVSGGALQVTKGGKPKELLPNLSRIGPPNRTQVDDGQVHLLNGTRFVGNVAPRGGGSSFYLSITSTLQYRLPAPPGHWLNIRQGDTLEMNAGAEDLDFPYPCGAGVVGGFAPEEQLGPGCSRPWYLRELHSRPPVSHPILRPTASPFPCPNAPSQPRGQLLSSNNDATATVLTGLLCASPVFNRSMKCWHEPLSESRALCARAPSAVSSRHPRPHRVPSRHLLGRHRPRIGRRLLDMPCGPRVRAWHTQARAVCRRTIRSNARPEGPRLHGRLRRRTLLPRGQHQQHVCALP